MANSTDSLSITVSAFVPKSPDRVWCELLHPGARWMLGANFETDMQVGSPITFEGHFFGRSFTDRGQLLAYERPHTMHFTHFSPMSGLVDEPENYHDIKVTLEPVGEGTSIQIVQENIATAELAEQAADQWRHALASLPGAELIV